MYYIASVHQPRSTMTKITWSTLAVLALLLLGPARSSAQDDQPIRSASVRHENSFTISPIHLLMPEFFASFEHKIQPKISVGILAGIGESSNFPVYEIGAKWSYYLIGTFEHGLPLTAELGYMHLSAGEGTIADDVSGSGSGVYLGPTIGYKYISDYGLTVNLAAGVQYFAITAKATDHSSGSTATASTDGIGPLLRLLVGWSF
jgi:hypothetical protein